MIWVHLVQVWRRSPGKEQERPTPRPWGQGPKERGLLRMLRRQIRQPESCENQTRSSATISCLKYLYILTLNRLWLFCLIPDLQHLQNEQHQAFSKSEEYLVVDQVISGLTCDFAHISPQVKRYFRSLPPSFWDDNNNYLTEVTALVLISLILTL